MTRRPGLTLTEVLVTLAILAFGVLAIMTMFPLAASQMAIAIREDRSAQAAASAEGYFRAYWKAEVVERERLKAVTGVGTNEQFYSALDDPNAYNPALTAAQKHNGPSGNGTFNPPLPDEPSYPVVIDPMGFEARATGVPYWVGDTGATGVASDIPRRTLNLLNRDKQYTFRTCSLMDGLGYDEDGHPLPDRELRYNWLWVIQRPQNVNKYAASLTVVVFDNRAHLFAPTGAEDVFSPPGNYTVTYTTGTTSVLVPGTPDVKPGGWVMDATVRLAAPAGSAAGTAATIPIRNANFYQVVSVVDNGNSTTTLELQSPIKPVNSKLNGSYTGTLVVLRGVSGVYPKPPLSAD